MGSSLSSPYEASGRNYTKPLTFHSLAPSGPSITWRVQWKLFSPNIKSYLGAFKTQQIYFCKRSLFACLRALHFIYRADINWCIGASKRVYIHSKIHFCDTHTTVSPEPGLREPCSSPCLCNCYSSLPRLRPPSLPSLSQDLPPSAWVSKIPEHVASGSHRGPDEAWSTALANTPSDSLKSSLLIFLHPSFLVHVLAAWHPSEKRHTSSCVSLQKTHLSKRLYWARV